MKRRKKAALLLVVAMVVTLSAMQTALAEPITLNISMDPAKVPGLQKAIDFYVLVFQKAGLELTVATTPLEQCLTDANAGRAGGTMFRIAGVLEGNKYPNLVMIPQAAGSTPYSAFSKLPGLKLAGFQDLKSYKVAAWKGSVIVEKGLTANVPSEQVVYVASDAEALQLAAEGKVDVAVVTTMPAYAALQTPGLKDSGLKDVGLMVAPPLYIMLNKKYEDYAPQVARIMKDLMNEGVYKEIVGVEPPQ